MTRVTDKQRKNCRRKKYYETREAAIFFAQADGLRPYRCQACNGWHLTSQNMARPIPPQAPTF